MGITIGCRIDNQEASRFSTDSESEDEPQSMPINASQVIISVFVINGSSAQP